MADGNQTQTDLGLAAWYEVIREAAGNDFDLLFEKV